MQRKPTKNTRGANSEEKRFMAYTKECSCIVCGNDGPSIVDHAMGATFKHNKVLIGHWFVIPLCLACDNVKTRGSRRGFENQFGSLSALWVKHVGNSDFEPPEEVFDAIVDMQVKELV